VLASSDHVNEKCLFFNNFLKPDWRLWHLRIVLYFSILLHCIVQWVLHVMFPSACSFIVLVRLNGGPSLIYS
jgi:hypothetical protein